MPGFDEVIKEIREVSEQNELTNTMKERVTQLDQEMNRAVLTAFVQRAIDEKRILMSDRIFSFIDEYIKGVK